MKKRVAKNRGIIVMVVLGLLLFFQFIGWLAPIENSLLKLLKPAVKLSYSTGVNFNQDYKNLTDKRDLLQLINEKTNQNKQLILANAQLRYIKEENQTLRQYLNFFNRTEYSYLLSNVLMKQPAVNNSDEHNKIMIDRGSNSGVRQGLLVIDQAGMIIGRITAVDKYKAEVSLITSPDFNLSVAIQADGNIIGIAHGDSGLTVKINFIPQTETVITNDTVVTSGLEENLPRGMILGKVSQINKESNELWQNAILESLADLDNLLIVSVLLPNSIIKAD